MGALTWEQFLALSDELKLTPSKKTLLTPLVEESVVRLKQKDHAYFADVLPKKDHWRALSEFGEAIGYLDIETTGCNPNWGDCITVIGLYNGFEMKTFVQGINLDRVPRGDRPVPDCSSPSSAADSTSRSSSARSPTCGSISYTSTSATCSGGSGSPAG